MTERRDGYLYLGLLVVTAVLMGLASLLFALNLALLREVRQEAQVVQRQVSESATVTEDAGR